MNNTVDLELPRVDFINIGGSLDIWRLHGSLSTDIPLQSRHDFSELLRQHIISCDTLIDLYDVSFIDSFGAGLVAFNLDRIASTSFHPLLLLSPSQLSDISCTLEEFSLYPPKLSVIFTPSILTPLHTHHEVAT